MTTKTLEPIMTLRERDDLRLQVDSMWDIQSTRISVENRTRSQSLAEEDPRNATVLGMLKDAEKTLKNGYKGWIKKSVFAPFIDQHKGVGPDFFAQVIALVGDPLIATPRHWVETPDGEAKRVLVDDEPYARSLSQLWQYAGHGAPGRRAKGMTQEDAFKLGNPKLKTVVHLMAESCVKQVAKEGQETPYFRSVYDARRIENADRTYPEGHAKAGQAWSDGHKHADALRIVGKEFLRELWLFTRKLHGLDGGPEEN